VISNQPFSASYGAFMKTSDGNMKFKQETILKSLAEMGFTCYQESGTGVTAMRIEL
jgi:hypothetical protein